MKIYTIGFTHKNARQFFELLRQNKVQRLVDIRLRPSGQLAGFTRKEDLPYFLDHLAEGCDYVHMPELAPSKEILDDYRRGGGEWADYVQRFEALMNERGIPDQIDRSIFESADCCLLCSEATPEQCHRRLVAERLQKHWPGVEITHL
jgi:uncharacterized protein (DUF488 family)